MESFEGLSAETVRRIKQDFIDDYNNSKPTHIDAMILNDIWISKYYGTYNGCVAAIFNEPFSYFHIDEKYRELVEKYLPHILYLPPDIVTGIPFYYEYSNSISIWKDGQFCSLYSAYDSGLLYKEDIRSIAYYFHNGYIKNREIECFCTIDPSDFDLIARKPLTDEIKTQISMDYPNFLSQAVNYYGTYNKAVVFRVQGGWLAHISEIAANILFDYPDRNTMRVWKEGQFYSLHTAYEEGILTKNDIKNIAYYYKGGI